MKKWLILTLIPLFLLLYGGFLWFLPAPTLPSETSETTPTLSATTPSTQPTVPSIEETTVETEAVTVPTYPPFSPEALTSRHAFVYDCGTETMLFSLGDFHEQIAPASLTKLFTAQVVLSYMKPDTIITAGVETTWIDPQSSVSYVTPGDTLSMQTLLQGMMMQSGNDAAYAAAVATGRVIAQSPSLSAKEALKIFVEEMNTQAQAMGLTGTHFVNPDGLDAYNHYTTVSDLLTIALGALENPLLRHYAGLYESHVSYENGESHRYVNTNFLLHPNSKYFCPDACGLKTGSTKQAGSCLLTLIYGEDGYRLIGVLGCPTYTSRFDDALLLYEYFCK